MKYEIEIEGLPDNWKPVAFRIGYPGECTIDCGEAIRLVIPTKFPCLIVEKIQPRRMSNIEILVEEAIKKISNMTPDEIKQMFIKHGYDPEGSKQPRRIVLEETEELKVPEHGEFYSDGIALLECTIETECSSPCTIWRKIKEDE